MAILASLALAAALPGCNNPVQIHNPPSLLGYVSQQNSNVIDVFDLTQNTSDGTQIQVGNGPTRMAINPVGTQDYLYVINSKSNSISAVNRRTQQVDFTANVGSSPNDLAVTPDGHFLYVANGGDASVTRIDLRDPNHNQTTIPLQYSSGSPAPIPVGLVVDPIPLSANAGSSPVFRTYVICQGNDMVYTLRDDSNAQDSVFVNLSLDGAVKPYQGAIATVYTGGTVSAHKLYVTDLDSTKLQIIDLSQPTLSPRQSPDLSANSSGIVSSPDGQLVYVTLPNYNTGQGVTGAIDWLATQTDTPSQPRATLGSQPGPLAITSNGNALYVGDQGTAQVELFPIQGTGSNVQLIIPRPAQFTNNYNSAQPPSDIVLAGGI